jgi:hypothetical protein
MLQLNERKSDRFAGVEAIGVGDVGMRGAWEGGEDIAIE